jgi:YrbI family 3-deoxy-D-manno-octulosonate 8-phosphate phosphatase
MVEDVRARASRIGIVFLDVDGVLTDGAMYYGEQGEALKRFNTRDGMGIARLLQANIRVGMVTGEETPIVLRRAEKLGVTEVYLGAKSKIEVLERVLRDGQLSFAHACFVGDDVNDLEVLSRVGFAVAVADAEAPVKAIAHYVTARPGGHGAVREVCDLILEAQGIVPPSGGGVHAGESLNPLVTRLSHHARSSAQP